MLDKLQVVGVAAVAAWLAGCATPATKYPQISQAAIAGNTQAVQRSSVDAVLARRSRANDITWPLLRANADLCYGRTRESFGLAIGNDRTIRDLVDGFSLGQVRALGYDDSALVLGVAAGSPAAAAGVKIGARPLKVGDEELNGSIEKLLKTIEVYIKLQAEAKKAGEKLASIRKPLRITFEQDGEMFEVALELETICDIPVNVPERDIVNASANGRSINLFRGLLTYFEDDEDIAFIASHEIGHVIGRHVPKQQRNALVSGYVLWGLPVGLGAGIFDTLLGGPLERWGGVETPPGRAGLTRLNNRVLGTRSFEREADYVGLYVASRGGIDIRRAETVFARFAEISPGSTYGERSHPVTADRILAIRATLEEIAAKQADDEELVPNDWPYPIGSVPDD